MIFESDFKPAWWLPGPHLQTLWPTLFRPRPDLDLTPERIELPDGDFLDLAWMPDNGGPLILVMHGLEGSLQSHYAGGMLNALAQAGFQAVFMHFRGCSGLPNRLPRSYHSGDTGDLEFVLGQLHRRAPVTGVVGFSLGGNVLLKWLGEQGKRAPVRAAVAISVPFRLDDAARRLEQGISRLYRNHLLRKLRASYGRKFSSMPSPLGSLDVARLGSFRAFDDQVTAALHGFDGVDDYYARSSSRQYLKAIHVPTLILHARDDPFMRPETVPRDSELSPSTILELCAHGGHVGFVSGSLPWNPRYWLEDRCAAFFSQQLQVPGAELAYHRAKDPVMARAQPRTDNNKTPNGR